MPLGYAFNLDGSSIYFTMAIAFIAQALNIPLSWGDYLLILAVLLLTSKGAAAVTGGGFITLAATLATMNGKVPVAGMVLVLGDRPLHERGARDHQPVRQHGRDDLRRLVGGHPGPGPGAASAGQSRGGGAGGPGGVTVQQEHPLVTADEEAKAESRRRPCLPARPLPRVNGNRLFSHAELFQAGRQVKALRFHSPDEWRV